MRNHSANADTHLAAQNRVSTGVHVLFTAVTAATCVGMRDRHA